jgi:hypothetical protein
MSGNAFASVICTVLAGRLLVCARGCGMCFVRRMILSFSASAAAAMTCCSMQQQAGSRLTI